jgi:hypothetical protein
VSTSPPPAERAPSPKHRSRAEVEHSYPRNSDLIEITISYMARPLNYFSYSIRPSIRATWPIEAANWASFLNLNRGLHYNQSTLLGPSPRTRGTRPPLGRQRRRFPWGPLRPWCRRRASTLPRPPTRSCYPPPPTPVSGNSNTVRNFPTHGQLSAAQGSLTNCLNFDFAI